MDVRHHIVDLVVRTVGGARTRTRYRKPPVGFADAGNEMFGKLKMLVDPSHATPEDILPQARTVVSFFIPFAPDVVRANRSHPFVAEEWAVAYQETNVLIQTLCRTLTSDLEAIGIHSAWELPTYEFDRERLVARWSHKSVAAIAGLGTFGAHQMLITEAGCAGRFGSIVMDAHVPSSQTRSSIRSPCGRGCRACLDLCPVGALTSEGLDKQKCYSRCLEVDEHYSSKLGGVFDVCGKCATGPCSLRMPRGDMCDVAVEDKDNW